MQITLNIPDNVPADILNQCIHSFEQQIMLFSKALNQSSFENKNISSQPDITLGDKTIDPSDLFGLWKEHPRHLHEIREQAWQRKD